jgi:hypothetical protein
MVDAAARVCLVCCTCLIGSEIRGGSEQVFRPFVAVARVCLVCCTCLIGSEIRGGSEQVFRPFVAVDKFILIVDYQQLAFSFESH